MLTFIPAVALSMLLALPTCTVAEPCSAPSVSAGGQEVVARDQLNTAASTRAKKQKAQPPKSKTSTVNTPQQSPAQSEPTPDPFKWCDKPRTFDEHNFCGLTKPIPSKGKDGKKAPKVSQIRQVVAKLRLPDSTPRLGPDPSVNEWNMLAVGYPIWLWTDQPNHLTTTANHDGLTFTLDATRIGTTFTMGDGHTKTCAATSVYPGHTRQPSPTCSYTYDTPSPIGHPYTITATNTWTITWHTNGAHGTLTHTTTGARTLDVGELQSLIRG